MNLLIDVGNTRIKWCVEENGKLNGSQALAHKQPDFMSELQKQWRLLSTPRIVAFSSVSTQQILQMLIHLAKNLWPEVKIIVAKSTSKAFSVSNAYAKPEKLGIDRWLGLIALKHYYSGKSCLIDCGTAITIDFLDEKGQHLGGLICPGLQLMKQSLLNGTENLGLIQKQYITGLSNDTEPAIYNGTLFAAVGIIEKVMNDFSGNDTIVMTGGDAERLVKQIHYDVTIEVDFVLKGLSLYCNGKG